MNPRRRRIAKGRRLAQRRAAEYERLKARLVHDRRVWRGLGEPIAVGEERRHADDRADR